MYLNDCKNNDYYHLGLTDSEVLESREKMV